MTEKNSKTKTPSLRFKGYTTDWEEKRLGEVATVAMNKRIFKDQTSESGDVPFYKIGTFGGKADAFISRKLFESYKAKYPYPQVGDILISASGSIGKMVEYKGEDAYFQDSNIVWLKHDGRIANSFLKQFYSIVKWRGLEGTTIKRLYNKDILATKIPLPSLPEQQRIGALFQHVDSLITQQERKCTQLQTFKRAMLQQMFPQPGQAAPAVRFAGFTGPWEEKKLGEVAEIIGGGTPSTKEPNYWDGDVNWFAPAEIGKEIYVHSSKRKITELGLEKSSAKLLPANKTILFTSRAGIGKTAILAEPAATNQGFQSLVLDDATDTYFVYTLSSEIAAEASRIASGSTFLEISGKSLGKLKFLFPSLAEQQQIGAYFHQLDDLLARQRQRLTQLKHAKKYLLQNMFPQGK